MKELLGCYDDDDVGIGERERESKKGERGRALGKVAILGDDDDIGNVVVSGVRGVVNAESMKGRDSLRDG